MPAAWGCGEHAATHCENERTDVPIGAVLPALSPVVLSRRSVRAHTTRNAESVAVVEQCDVAIEPGTCWRYARRPHAEMSGGVVTSSRPLSSAVRWLSISSAEA